MKIERTSGSQAAQKTKKADKAKGSDGAGFGKALQGAGGAAGASGAAPTQSIGALDALLAVQGAEDPTERAARGRMRQRADRVLDTLETMREALLRGDLTVGHMVNIADTVARHREKISDPQLTALLDEVDLRAQIELAKMSKALEMKDKR